jgi:hypothetical protein
LLFVLIGLQFLAILKGLQERSVWEVLFYTLLELLAARVVRGGAGRDPVFM